MMKRSLVFLTVYAFLIGLNIESIECVGEDALLELLEEIRKRMCHPISKFGLPALDPLQIQHVEIDVNNNYLIDFKGSITDFRLTGLSDFVIDELKISANPLRRSKFIVTLPLTSFKSLYSATGSLGHVANFGGGGNAEASLDKLQLSASWQLKAGITLGIRNLKITITIGGIEIDFENLFEEYRITKFFQNLVHEMGVELLNDIWQDKNESVQKLVEQKINRFIGKYTISDILKIIGGTGDGPIFGENDPPGDCKEEPIGNLV